MMHQSASTEFLGRTDNETFIINKEYLQGEGNQLRLYHTHYSPKQNPVATVCIIHGFAEYSGRYKHIAEHFVAKKFDVLLVDLRGFGYSGGARGCAEAEQLERDIITLIKKANTNIPLFIYAHSLGALLTLSLLIDYPYLNVSGIILTSPFLGFPDGKGFGRVKTWALKQLGVELEDFVINSMINPTALTKKNKQVANIFGDRLMIPFLSIRMARSVIITIEKVFESAPSFKTPVIIFHGKNDTVANYKSTVQFIDKLGSKNKELKIFDNGYHQLQHDEECTQMLRIIDTWLEKVDSRSLMVLNLNKVQIKKRKVNWKWLIVLIYALMVLFAWKRRKPNTSAWRILFSPFLLATKQE